MSAGHHHPSTFTQGQLDDILDKVLANKKVKEALARPYTLVTDYDIALLGSSSVDHRHVYLDRHLRSRNCPYGVIVVDKSKLDVKPGLVRHERLEQILEDVFGWSYDAS